MKKKTKPVAQKPPVVLTPQQVSAIQAAWQELVTTQLEEPLVCLETTFEREAGLWYLRAYIDTPEKNISLDQCVYVTQQLAPLVESLPIPETCHYHLEISSPGVFRVLKTEKDFIFYQGESVIIKQGDTLLASGVFKHYEVDQQLVQLHNSDNQIIELSIHTPDIQIQLNPSENATVLVLANSEDATHA